MNPGVTRTELHTAGGLDDERYAAFVEHSKTTHPIGRIGKPEEVADLALFLLSDDAGFCTESRSRWTGAVTSPARGKAFPAAFP